MDLMKRRQVLMASIKSARLPSAYQEIEYLESGNSGNQYIDTQIAQSDGLIFEIDFQLTRLERAVYFMGEYSGSSFYLYVANGYIGENAFFQTAFGISWTNTRLLADLNRHKFIYEISGGNLTVIENEHTILAKSITTLSTASIKVAGTTHSPSLSCRTFESKMTKAGVVIQDLIPCYRKSDNKPGMYDLVTGAFLTNAGENEFDVGPDVI